MPTINDLRQQAATIKNATQVGENTATRVGTTFETIADLLEGMGGITNLSTIDIGSIDTLNTTGDMLVGTPNIYTLTKTIGANTFKVGTLFQFANNGRYDVAQVIVSQFIVDADGRIDTTSADQEVHIFYRLCKTMNGGSLPTPIGTWTTWTELGGSGGSGVTIDPYPTQNSGNAVSSGGVFERLQDVAPKVDISAIDDIDEYSDMLATKSPFYVVTKTLSGNVFRIGTLMEFANQGRYILYQILATDYVLNDDGTLDTTTSENGGLKLIWRMKQFSGNPPAGVTIGVWSTWSYLSGGGAQPDNEDIDLNADDQLQFANKAYDASAFSGLGRVYLRKNIVTSGGVDKNVLTQAMMNTANTIYHIQYDYDLNGQTITLPAGCVLEFDGGSIGNGTIIFNGTIIKADGIAFKSNITISTSSTLAGGVKVGWFAGVENDSVKLNTLLNSGADNIYLDKKVYHVHGTQ